MTIILTDPVLGSAEDSNGAVPLGYYQHYKGAHYQLLAIATHSEELKPYAVYRALYGDFGLWIRPLAMFMETVQNQGQAVARFKFIGTELPN